jgi:hypothetical protein
MNTSFNVNWSDVVAVLGGFGVLGLMLVLIAYVQLWRYRVQRAVKGSATPLDARIGREPQSEVQREKRIQEFLENANFSTEGNPNFGWKERFFERSFNSWLP